MLCCQRLDREDCAVVDVSEEFGGVHEGFEDLEAGAEEGGAGFGG